MKVDNLGYFLWNLREKSGLTRKQVVKEIGKSEGTLKNYEMNITEPDASVLVALLDLYEKRLHIKISMDKVFGR